VGGTDQDDQSDPPKGLVDFRDHPSIAEVVEGSPTKFLLRPIEPTWNTTGNSMTFTTGKDGGRIFHFDAKDSEHDRDAWIEALNRHIQFAGDLANQLEPQNKKESMADIQIEAPDASSGGVERKEQEKRSMDDLEEKERVHSSSETDRVAVRDLLNAYIKARIDYDSEALEAALLEDGDSAVMNGYFGQKLMLEKEGRGLDFLMVFLDEEKKNQTNNKICRGQILSFDVFEDIAIASISFRGWQTLDKGCWRFEEALQLMKVAGKWKIVAQLYSATTDDNYSADLPTSAPSVRFRERDSIIDESTIDEEASQDQLRSQDDGESEQAVRKVLQKYSRARRKYNVKKMQSLFLSGGHKAFMNGIFQNKPMFDHVGNGLPFLFTFLAEEKAKRTTNTSCRSKVDSIRICGNMATATLLERGWRTVDKGGWQSDKNFHLLKVDGEWKIVAKLYIAKPDPLAPYCSSPPDSEASTENDEPKVGSTHSFQASS
jgi:hypothetical protein